MNKLTTAEFLKYFPNHVYQTYDDKGTDNRKAWATPDFDEKLFKELNTNDKRSICFSVNGFSDGTRQLDHLSNLNAIYCDIDFAKSGDGKTLADVKEPKKKMLVGLLKLQIKPNLITITRNGLQPFWLLENENLDKKTLEDYETTICGIIEWSKEYGSAGDQVKDIPRALRLPGFYHVKEDPFMVDAYEFNKTKTSIQELKKLFPYFDNKIIENDNAATKEFDSPLKDIDIRDIVIKAYQKFGEPEASFDKTGRICLARGVTGGFQGKEGDRQYIATGSHDVPAGNKVTFVRRLFKMDSNREAYQWIVEEFNIKLPRRDFESLIPAADIVIPKFDPEEEFQRIINPPKVISFGYQKFDEILGGLKEEFTYLIAAKTGEGKSALALNILHNLAQRGSPATFFDLENGRGTGEDRLLQIHTGWSKKIIDSFRSGEYDPKGLKKALKDINNTDRFPLIRFYSSDPLFNDGINYKNILTAIEKVVKERGVKTVVIDNLRNLQVKGQDENSFLSEALTNFDKTANTLKISIILIHHVSIKDTEKGITAEDVDNPTYRPVTIPPISKTLGTSDLVNKVKAALTIALDKQKNKMYVWIQKNRDGQSDRRFALNICLLNLCITDPFEFREPIYDGVTEADGPIFETKKQPPTSVDLEPELRARREAVLGGGSA